MLDDADLEPSASSSGILARDLRKAKRESDPTLPTRDNRASTAGSADKRKSKLPFIVIGIALLGASAFVIAGMNRDGDPPARTAQATLPAATQPTPPPTPPPAPPQPVDPVPTPVEGSATPTEGSAAVVDPPADPTPPVADPTPTENPTEDPGEKPTKKPTKKPRVASDEPKTPKVKEPVKEPVEVKTPEPRDGGCDEVSCVMDKYARACCAKYKPADSGYKPPVKPTEIPATLDKTMIRTGTAKVKAAIIECGVKANAKGTVKVSVNVGPDGRVGSASVVSSPDPELGDCVAGAIRKANYGRTVNGGTFTYPFVF